jgi:HAD superfamily hydrolase (TIGR01549 family)
MIKAIIFDLDMCILDPRSMRGAYFQPVLDPLQDSDLSPERKESISELLWTTSLEDTIEHFSIPKEIGDKMREAFIKLESPESVATFGDEKHIKSLAVKKFLVTSGFTRFQRSKIAKLGIADLFDEVVIDEIDDPSIRKGKKKIFEEIARDHNLQASEVLVVGDNPLSELRAGKSLGMPTVQTLRPGVSKWDEADYHIQDFSELSRIID